MKPFALLPSEQVFWGKPSNLSYVHATATCMAMVTAGSLIQYAQEAALCIPSLEDSTEDPTSGTYIPSPFTVGSSEMNSSVDSNEPA